MEINALDLTTFSGIAVASYVLIEILKRSFPDKSFINGKESIWAMGFSILLGGLAWTLMGSFVGMSLGAVLLNSFLAGVMSSVVHDRMPSKDTIKEDSK